MFSEHNEKDGIKIGAAYRQVYQEEIKNFDLRSQDLSVNVQLHLLAPGPH
jgi:hypothetical protein